MITILRIVRKAARRFSDALLDDLASRIAQRIPAAIVQGERSATAESSTRSSIAWFINGLEWEMLANPIEADVERVGSESGDFGVVVIKRDADFGMSVELETPGKAPWTEEQINAEPGSFGLGIEIACTTKGHRPLLIPEAFVSGSRWNWKKGQITTKVGILSHKILRSDPGDLSERPPHLLVDWYISGPETGLVFLRGTERRHAESFSRARDPIREGSDAQTFALPTPPPKYSAGHSRDHLAIDLPEGVVRVCRVSDEHAPSWTRPTSIEFPYVNGEPTKDLREGIAEVLGFVFGRHILQIGTTILDAGGHPLREEARVPWGDDVAATARRGDTPVTDLVDWDNGITAETVLNPIAKAFLSARTELNLSQVVWTIWVAQRMPSTMDTPLYGAALQTLMHGWFATRSKSKGTYMKVEDFRRVFAEGIERFKTASVGVTYGDRIAAKVQRAFEMSGNERLRIFFEEIGLPVDDGEWAVIRSRNVGAHGNKALNTREELVMLGNGYRTLVNRALLKVLGFKGHYIDYSVVGHHRRHLDDPIGYRPI